MYKWERRDKKLQAQKRRMPVHGRGFVEHNLRAIEKAAKKGK